MSDPYVPNISHPRLDNEWKTSIVLGAFANPVRLSQEQLLVHRALLIGVRSFTQDANTATAWVGPAQDRLIHPIEPEGVFQLEDPLGRQIDLRDYWVQVGSINDNLVIDYKE